MYDEFVYCKEVSFERMASCTYMGSQHKHWVISSLQKASTMDKCVFIHTTTTALNNSSVCGAKTASHSHRRQSEKERVKVICSFLVTFIINSA